MILPSCKLETCWLPYSKYCQISFLPQDYPRQQWVCGSWMPTFLLGAVGEVNCSDKGSCLLPTALFQQGAGISLPFLHNLPTGKSCLERARGLDKLLWQASPMQHACPRRVEWLETGTWVVVTMATPAIVTTGYLGAHNHHPMLTIRKSRMSGKVRLAVSVRKAYNGAAWITEILLLWGWG